MVNQVKNVAIIMDGNGRWAKQRSRPRVWGHIRGSRRVHDIVNEAAEMGLSSLTLYAFSTENWSRPTLEVKNLFKILKKYLKREKETLLRNNIKFNVIGNYKVLDSGIVLAIEELIDVTKENTGLNLSLAINYGGRAEILDSVNKCLKQGINREITEEDIVKNLYQPNIQDIDLLIRTAGDKRVSNFLLWQICYSEFYFSDTQWPDFTRKEFRAIISSVDKRERRFGGVSENTNLVKNTLLARNNQKALS